jgi:hypothetical protein
MVCLLLERTLRTVKVRRSAPAVGGRNTAPVIGFLKTWTVVTQTGMDLGLRRGAAVRSGKKAEGWKSGCDALEEDFRGPAVRKGVHLGRWDSQKVIRVGHRLAAQARWRSQILTAILGGHGPGDEAEWEQNDEDRRRYSCRSK